MFKTLKRNVFIPEIEKTQREKRSLRTIICFSMGHTACDKTAQCLALAHVGNAETFR